MTNSTPLFALVALALAACTGNPKPGSGSCDDNEDCDQGQYCHDGVCLELCRTDDDCPPGLWVCGANGLCVPPADPECDTLAECTTPPTAYAICFVADCRRGSCVYTAQPAVTCEPAVCTNGFVLSARTCGAEGLCPAPDPIGVSCNGYACAADGLSCRTSCSAPEHCLGSLQCLANNTCEAPLVKGDPCSFNAECSTLACECADAACTTRVCAAADCGTCHLASGAGDCTTTDLDDDVADPEECDGDSVCSAGACRLLDDQPCTLDAQCVSDHCECVDATCSSRRCNQNDCPCQFNNDSDDFCDGNLDADLEDVLGGCVAPQSCRGDGSCASPALLADGATGCSADGDCESGNCDTSAHGPSEIGRCCPGENPNSRGGTGGLVAFSGGVHCCADDADCGLGSFCRASTFQCVTGSTTSPATNFGACDDLDDCNVEANFCCEWGYYDDCQTSGGDCRCTSGFCP